MATLNRAPTPKQFATAWTRGFARSVRDAAGRDGRLSKSEAQKMDPMHRDNALNYLEATGQKSVSVDKLIGKGHNYALATASNVAGNGNRVSLLEARSLPTDLRADFFALRGKEMPDGRLSGSALSDAFAAAGQLPDGSTVTYMSEGDYEVLPVRFDKKIDDGNILSEATKHFQADLGEWFDFPLAYEKFNEASAQSLFSDLGDYEGDPEYAAESAAFARLGKVFGDNLDGVEVFRVGAREDDGTLAIDAGTYFHFVLGTDKDGNSAGVFYGSVET